MGSCFFSWHSQLVSKRSGSGSGSFGIFVDILLVFDLARSTVFLTVLDVLDVFTVLDVLDVLTVLVVVLTK